MPRISTGTRKRLVRSQRRRQREVGVRTPARNQSSFRFDAALRIAGVGAQHEKISLETGLMPSYVHRAGDPRSKRTAALGSWPEDLWMLRSPLDDGASLEEHLVWLWNAVSAHKTYFSQLIASAAWADISLGCLSESIYPVFSIDAKSMTITRELNLGVSFNFTCT